MTEYNKRTLKNVLEDYCEEHEAELLKEIEDAKNDPLYMVQEDEVKQYFRSHRNKKLRKHARKYVTTAASIVAIFAAIITTATISAQGDKEPCYEYVTERQRDLVVLHNPLITDELDEYRGNYIPKYIPAGYSVFKIENTRTCYYLSFYDRYDLTNENMIWYIEYPDQKTFEYALSFHETYEQVKINDYPGMYFVTDDKRELHFFIGDTLIGLSTNDPDVDIFYLAEQVMEK